MHFSIEGCHRECFALLRVISAKQSRIFDTSEEGFLCSFTQSPSYFIRRLRILRRASRKKIRLKRRR